VPGAYFLVASYATPSTVIVPLVEEAVIVPSAAPLQDTLVPVAVKVTAAGWVMVILPVAGVQLLPSVTE